jgi:hypothetical protein
LEWGDILGLGKNGYLDIDFRDFVGANGLETGIVEGGGSRAIGHYADQGGAGGELADAPAKAFADAQGYESAAWPGESFVGGKVAFLERFAAVSSQRECALGCFEKKLFLAISE